ncbi:shikimate 5-dehydrogenase [Actinomyces viscosus]|uniref:Shikimate 5-dehydrogenase-like protein HI_0607 n=1 Tax=Actinomyces viscosus TaxID=1656 RepID=A0A448PMY9_ACTVI|nr:shikimate 5-dehydrogenase [Actinomyces viscosus]TFH51387.1 shikimate 5-dehydrogenase [Actinomyces viscosus]VEI17414.1 Shikimate 5-dehydrogenase-like protein HI_0607 [Actinomyces viscosus]
MRDITKDTRLCISLSARPTNIGTRFHNYLYELLDLDFVYKAFTTTDITAAIAGVRGLGIRGCSVSMPWKEDVIALVDEMTPSASAIASVNTIVNTDGHLTAYNTDFIAIRSLLDTHEVPRSSCAVLGAGGMAKACVAALTDAGFGPGTVVARNTTTGPALAEQYGWTWAASPEDLAGDGVGLLLNATPVGMAGGPAENELPASEDLIAATGTVFDVVAFPAETPLVRTARAADKKVITGAEVIALQAAEQFALYTGVRPTPEQVAEASRVSRA